MRKIFIDCGGNVGQSIDLFKNTILYSSDFIIYSFEPVPKLNHKYRNRRDIIFSDKAVWINDDDADFYIGKRHNGIGSTLKKEKWSCAPDFEHPIRVKCFDFSKWIIDNFSKEDYIILKMDIEGAEYDVLEKMIADGSIEYINKIFIEFHLKKMNMKEERHFNLVNKLMEVNNLELLSQLKDIYNYKKT